MFRLYRVQCYIMQGRKTNIREKTSHRTGPFITVKIFSAQHRKIWIILIWFHAALHVSFFNSAKTNLISSDGKKSVPSFFRCVTWPKMVEIEENGLKSRLKLSCEGSSVSFHKQPLALCYNNTLTPMCTAKLWAAGRCEFSPPLQQ